MKRIVLEGNKWQNGISKIISDLEVFQRQGGQRGGSSIPATLISSGNFSTPPHQPLQTHFPQLPRSIHFIPTFFKTILIAREKWDNFSWNEVRYLSSKPFWYWVFENRDQAHLSSSEGVSIHLGMEILFLCNGSNIRSIEFGESLRAKSTNFLFLAHKVVVMYHIAVAVVHNCGRKRGFVDIALSPYYRNLLRMAKQKAKELL